jgi:phosphoglycolate phosphatase
MFKAVLFDLDGTILNTLVDLADAMNASLAHFGYPPHPVEAYKYFIGDAVETEAKRALPASALAAGEAGPESARDIETIKKVAALSEQIYDKCWHKNTKPYPGIPELLSNLASRGLLMAVLSNKPDHFTKIMVEKLFPRGRFEIVRGALPDVPIKPDPTSALQIAKGLCIPPEQFLYIGDTNTDMKTAVNAGMFPLGVLWGYRTADELLAAGAKALVNNPADVLEILDNPQNI